MQISAAVLSVPAGAPAAPAFYLVQYRWLLLHLLLLWMLFECCATAADSLPVDRNLDPGSLLLLLDYVYVHKL